MKNIIHYTSMTIVAMDGYDDDSGERVCDIRTNIIDTDQSMGIELSNAKIVPYVLTQLLKDSDEFSRLAEKYLGRFASEVKEDSDVSGSEA